MNGPDHYRKAEGILAEIEARPDMARDAEAALSIHALAHAMLANAAATAIGGRALEEREWMDAAGTGRGRSPEPGTRH